MVVTCHQGQRSEPLISPYRLFALSFFMHRVRYEQKVGGHGTPRVHWAVTSHILEATPGDQTGR